MTFPMFFHMYSGKLIPLELLKLLPIHTSTCRYWLLDKKSFRYFLLSVFRKRLRPFCEMKENNSEYSPGMFSNFTIWLQSQLCFLYNKTVCTTTLKSSL